VKWVIWTEPSQNYPNTFSRETSREEAGCGTYMGRQYKERRCEGVHWIKLAQNRMHWSAFVNTEMNLRVPQR
jgi:hypothetical protein